MVKIFLVTLCITYAIGCQIDCTINDDALHSTLHHFTTEKPALLHSICYSMCITKVITAFSNDIHMDCATIQKVEACQYGCIIHNLHHKKTRDNICAQECINKCGNEEKHIDWRKFYSLQNCSKQCEENDCVQGCSLKHVHRNKVTELTLPSPEIKPVIGSPTSYIIDMTSLTDNSTRDLKVAMVIKIIDQNTNDIYYNWLPGLQGLVDLSYFSCKRVTISAKIIYGYEATSFSSSEEICVNGSQDFSEFTRKDLCDKMYLKSIENFDYLETKVNELLDYIQTTSDLSSRDQIEIKLQEIINIFNN